MKNQYLFFESQDFVDVDLTDFNWIATQISNTPVFLYDFEFHRAGGFDNSEAAKKLDELTIQFTRAYPDKFQTILSGSSQYYCSQLYPLIVEFETTLRCVIYISRALFENGNVNKDALLIDIDKTKKPIEELDFGKIYEALFTDATLKSRVKQNYDRVLTKEDLIKRIIALEEDTLWKKLVGQKYNYIEKHFLLINEYRNDIMHSHLIDYATYLSAKDVLETANEELRKAITDKLISNESDSPNSVNIIDVLKGLFAAMSIVSTKINDLKKTGLGIGFERFMRFFIVSTSNSEIKYPENELLNDEEEALDIIDGESSSE